MRRLAASGLVVVAVCFVTGAASPESPLEKEFETVVSRPEYTHAMWGLAVADLASGKMLYSYNEEKLFAPASTTKLFSTAAALLAFGPDHKFVTPVYRTGTLASNGKLDGDLIIRASGDPSLSGRIDAKGHLAWTNHDHTYANGEDDATLTDTDVLAGLKDLAAQVASSGIRQVRDVVIDDRLFDKAEGSGSGPSQLVPIVVNDNVIDVLTTPASSVGEAATVIVRPRSQFAQFDMRVVTVNDKQDSVIDIEEVAPRKYSVRGQIAMGHAPMLRVAEVSNPVDFARTLFVECLSEKGITVERSALADENREALPAPSLYETLTVAARHTSPPFAEQMRVVLKVSHNLAASLLPLLVGVENGGRDLEAGMRRQGDLLKQLGVDVEAISFAGGAGGTRADFVTPHAVIELLHAMSKRSDFQPYYDALPVLGVDGTLFNAVGPASVARGKVSAKTGTLVWENTMDSKLMLLSKAMSGYMTAATGRRLAFALYLNNAGVKNAGEIDVQAKTLGEVAEMIYRSY